MTNRHTQVRADKKELVVSSTSTDAPILPIQQLERLNEFAPKKVDWVFDETETEAGHRRSENSKLNERVHKERMTSLWLAGAIAIAGMVMATICASIGREIVGSVIGGVTLSLVVSSFIFGPRRKG